MRRLVIVAAAGAAALLCGCGSALDSLNAKEESGFVDEEETVSSCPVAFKGFVGTDYITVNDAQFKTPEMFYTAEQTRFGSTAEIEGGFGALDFFQGITVTISPTGNEGYGEQVTADRRNGSFVACFPADAVQTTYHVRATKRIAVTTAEGDRKCYNLETAEHQVDFADRKLPIYMRQFVTQRTLYECVSDPTSDYDVLGE